MSQRVAGLVCMLGFLFIVPSGVFSQTNVISEGEQWRFFRGLSAPPEGWMEPGFDPDEFFWEAGPTGFGYGDEDDATILDDMLNNYLTVYLLKEFEVDEELEDFFFTLSVRYDDGFVAYLDGEEILRRNVTGFPPLFDEPASELHEIVSPVGFDETILLDDLDIFLDPGSHVLAVEVHNFTVDSSDLSFSAALDAGPFIVLGLEPDFGPLEGGNTVSVIGAGFDSTSLPEIRFDGTPSAAVEFVNSGRLDVVVPASTDPGPVDVEIEDARGLVTLPLAYRYSGGITGLQFDGSAVATATGLEIFDEGTFEVWFRRNPETFFNPWRIILAVQSIDGGDAFRLESQGGNVRARTFTGAESSDLTAGVTLEAEEWHHLAMTFDVTGRSLYFDGNLVGSDQLLMSLPENATVQFGDAFVDGGFFDPQPYTGIIESARLWNVARTADEIRRTMFQVVESDDPASGLEASWPLLEGQGESTEDVGPWGIPLILGQFLGFEDLDPAWTPIEDFPSYAVTTLTPAEGSLEGGNIITLFGVGFSIAEPPVVFFGNNSALDVMVIDRWSMEVEVPAGDAFGPVDVTIEGTGGTFVLPAAYTYLPGTLYALVSEGEIWDYLVGEFQPSIDWSFPDFDPTDAGWSRGPTGIGYGDGDDATDLPTMQNFASTLYARRTFELHGTSNINYLVLRLRYDDGFVAYLNGAEIQRSNVAGQPPAFDELASDQHEITGGAGVFDEEYDLLTFRDQLRAGVNVLAIEVHNATIDSSDLSLSAELIYSAPGGAFVRGDVDKSGALTVTDAVLMLLHAYSGRHVSCEEAADVDDDGRLSTTDAVVLLNYLFLRGVPPSSPFPESAPDLDDDGLDCSE